jgi:hypothetical protein
VAFKTITCKVATLHIKGRNSKEWALGVATTVVETGHGTRTRVQYHGTRIRTYDHPYLVLLNTATHSGVPFGTYVHMYVPQHTFVGVVSIKDITYLCVSWCHGTGTRVVSEVLVHVDHGTDGTRVVTKHIIWYVPWYTTMVLINTY